MSVLLEVEGLSVDIATGGGTLHAVRGLSFRVRRGETLCLVGESGCGKSMTALAIMDLLPTTATRNARRLRLRRATISSARAHRRDLRGNRMAMIFQEPMTALNPAYTIGNQLMEALSLHHKGGAAAAARDARRRPAREGRHRLGGRAPAANIRTSFPAACASAS